MDQVLTQIEERLVPEFEADCDPSTGFPRIRFNFSNGWSASVLVRTGTNGCDAMQSSLAACPTGAWGTGKTELGSTEATADEVIGWLDEIRRRPVIGESESETVPHTRITDWRVWLDNSAFYVTGQMPGGGPYEYSRFSCHGVSIERSAATSGRTVLRTPPHGEIELA